VCRGFAAAHRKTQSTSSSPRSGERNGATTTVLSQDAYGHGPVSRTITALRGDVRHGDSGGPAIDGNGAVAATVFAARLGSQGGFGVPTGVVRKVLAKVGTAKVSTGACAT
jgi:hypothetical protein